MSRGRHATPVKLARKERQELQSLIRRTTAAQRDVTRARIALMAHEGYTSVAISQELGVSVQSVSQWRQRIARQGAQGIREAERSGRPPRITQETRLQLIALACEVQEAQGRATPTLDEIVTRAVERGIVEQISRSHVQRILQAGDVRPHRVQQWLHASWVNQIELWFGLYTRRVLRHASHTSTVHLRERTEQFIRERNQTARPFRWTFRGYPLQTGAS